ncbi:MAG: GFA family protein [Pseudomonadota bacterium]
MVLNGSCNCGGVTFFVRDGGQSVTACHCGQCRKQSGHHWASGYTDVSKFDIKGAVRWFDLTPAARRGFCPTCGCFLFWKAHDEDGMSFSLGAIDGPTGLRLHKHIFTAHKGDYYDIADNVPQRED